MYTRSQDCSSKGNKLSLSHSRSQQPSHSKTISSKFKTPLNINKNKNVVHGKQIPQQGLSKRKSSDGSGPDILKPIDKKKRKEIEACALCQMPWQIYDSIDRARSFHTDKCLDLDLSSKQDCSNGLECNEQLEQHYWKFNHQILANVRAEEERVINSMLVSQKQREQNRKSLKDSQTKNDSGFEDAPCTTKVQAQCKENVIIISDSEDEVSSQKSSGSRILFSMHSNPEISSQETIMSSHVQKEIIEKQVSALHASDINANVHEPYDDDDFFQDGIPDLDLNLVSGVHNGSREKIIGWDDETVIFDENKATNHTENSQTSQIVLPSNEHSDSHIMSQEKSEDLGSVKSSQSESLLRDVFLEEEQTTTKSSSYTMLREEETGSEKLAAAIASTSKSIVITDDAAKQASKLGSSKNHEEEGQEEESTEEEKPNENLISINEFNIDSDDDDLFTNLVAQAMEKYLGESESDCEMDNKKQQKPETPHKDEKPQRCRNEGSCKPCVHLHFHVEKSPQKSPKKGQTTILSFFQPNDTKKEESTNKCSACCNCNCLKSPVKVSGTEAASSWKGLMSKMQGKPKYKTSVNNMYLDQVKKEEKPLRQCPFYKYIPDTSFVVDAFCYGILSGVKAYFLTHFHYDHYRGLTKKFNQPIYCSEITGKLVSLRIGVPLKFLHHLPMEEPRVVHDVEVTLLDANHCPGAVMFLFKLRTGATVLHVGDFRAHPKMESYSELWNCEIDTLYLDTTYCNATYDFPTQEEVIEKAVSIATSHVEENSKTLIVVGSYSIGKERVFKAIASALNCKIWASNDKQKTLRCIQDEEICSRLTSEKLCARIHVLPMKELQPKKLISYVENLKPKFSVVVAIRPTGWEHSCDQGPGLQNLIPKQCGNVYMYGIPYSEHSSFNELSRFVQYLQPKKIIPTVNVGNANIRRQMEKYFQEWIIKSQQKFLAYSKPKHLMNR